MRLLHTMIRVTNLEASIAFYTEVMEMKLLRQHDYPEGRFTLAFVGYEDEANSPVTIELTHNWDTHQYRTGRRVWPYCYRGGRCLPDLRKN